MLLRWTKRVVWLVVLAALVLVPARLAHVPTAAQGADGNPSSPPAAPMTGPSPMVWIAALSGLGALGIGIARRHRKTT